jgi:hypothetical protein
VAIRSNAKEGLGENYYGSLDDGKARYAMTICGGGL